MPNCLEFNGTSDYVDVGDRITLGKTFTQEAWIYPTESNDDYHGFLGYQADSGERSPSLWVDRQKLIHAGFTDEVDRAWNYFITDPVLTHRAWNHVAVTFDGTTYKAYANGKQCHSQDFPNKIPVGAPVKYIGRVDNFFSGRIAEVRIWNVARTENDISANMNQRLIGSEPGLVGYWKLDGATDDCQTNGNLNNGTLNGGTWVSDPDLKLSDPDDSVPSSGTNMELVVAAILTDLAAAQNLANEFSQQLSQKHKGNFKVPNVVLKEIELDLRFVLEKIVKPASGIPNANIIVDLNTLQALPPEFISSLKLQAILDRYGWKMK